MLINLNLNKTVIFFTFLELTVITIFNSVKLSRDMINTKMILC